MNKFFTTFPKTVQFRLLTLDGCLKIVHRWAITSSSTMKCKSMISWKMKWNELKKVENVKVAYISLYPISHVNLTINKRTITFSSIVHYKHLRQYIFLEFLIPTAVFNI